VYDAANEWVFMACDTSQTVVVLDVRNPSDIKYRGKYGGLGSAVYGLVYDEVLGNLFVTSSYYIRTLSLSSSYSLVYSSENPTMSPVPTVSQVPTQETATITLGGTSSYENTYLYEAYSIVMDKPRSWLFTVNSISYLTKWDMSNPNSVSLLGSLQSTTYWSSAQGLAYDEDGMRCFVAGTSTNQFGVADCSGDTPIVMGYAESSAYLDAPYGIVYDSVRDYVIIAVSSGTNMAIYDVSVSTLPFFVGSLKDATMLSGLRFFCVRCGERPVLRGC
jgi:hypothetical protein